jgi:hypothetical protein
MICLTLACPSVEVVNEPHNDVMSYSLGTLLLLPWRTVQGTSLPVFSVSSLVDDVRVSVFTDSLER